MSTFQNKKFTTNRFQKRVNRFTNPTFKSEEYIEFDFNNNLKSINLEDLYFTNFTSSDKSKKYLKLEEVCIKIRNNINEWTKLFIADEIEFVKDIPKMNRLNNIITTVNSKKINTDEIILKFKNLEDQEFQLYIKNENGILKLYLIDLYHLGIEAKNVKTGRIDLKGIYKARKKYNYDIKNIENKIQKEVF